MKLSILPVILIIAATEFNGFAVMASTGETQNGRNLRGFQHQRVMQGLRNGNILETMPPSAEESFLSISETFPPVELRNGNILETMPPSAEESFESIFETIPPVEDEAVVPEPHPDDLVTTDMSSPESLFTAGDSVSDLLIEDYGHICEGRKGCTCSGEGYSVYKSPRDCVRVDTENRVEITGISLFTEATAQCSDQKYTLTPVDCNFCDNEVSITGNPTQSNHFISAVLSNGMSKGLNLNTNFEVHTTSWCIRLNEYNNDEFIFALNDDSKECHTHDYTNWKVEEQINGESKYDLKFQDCQGNNP